MNIWLFLFGLIPALAGLYAVGNPRKEAKRQADLHVEGEVDPDELNSRRVTGIRFKAVGLILLGLFIMFCSTYAKPGIPF